MDTTYDVVVVGAGAAGENAAGRAAQHGLSAVIVEAELVGGECSYWACMPSKALLRPGEVLEAARRVPGADAAVTGTLDVEAALARRDRLVADFDDADQVAWLERAGVDLVRGRGRLAGERQVAVAAPDGSAQTLVARRAVVVATGSRSAVPPVDGLADIRYWDNRQATTARAVPDSLLVLGAGAVGVELAQAWKRLGAREVRVVELFDRLLMVEEPAAGAALAETFEREGILVHVNAKATRARREDADGPVTLELSDGTTFEGDELLVATGRRPSTDDLGLETVGLEPGRPVAVDDRLRATGVDGGWLYAVGDVNGRSLLTHMGKHQARIAADVIAGRDARDTAPVTRVVFTDPQVAAVGLTEAKAREQGLDVDVVTHDLSVSGAAVLGRGIGGHATLIVDRDRRVLVGATFIAPTAGEMLHAATIAVAAEVPVDQLWQAVPAFPTVSEVWLRLLEAYGL